MAVSDIEIGITVESLADHFLISPNALHRGEDEYSTLTLHERGMLAALLTFRPGTSRQWNTSRSGINDLAPELGRDKISSILKGLRNKRYLYTRRVNMGHGRFRWEWRVFMKARPTGFDPFAGETPTIDGTTIDGKHVNGDDQQEDNVSAGRTIDGCSVPDQPSLKEVPSPRSTKKNPPLPSAPPAPTVVPDPEPGGEETTDEETTAITTAIRHQPTWRPATIRAAIRQAISEGLPAQVAYQVIVELAEGTTYGPTTAGPQRIIARGPWWQPGEVFVPAKRIAAACPKHPSEPAHNCACCAGERIAAATPREPAAQPTKRSEETARLLSELSGYKFGAKEMAA